MGVVRLLNGDVATVYVVAKFFKSRCVLHHEIVDLVCLFQAAIGDFKRQLHNV